MYRRRGYGVPCSPATSAITNPFLPSHPSPLSSNPRSPTPYYCGRRINRVSITSSSKSLLYIYIYIYHILFDAVLRAQLPLPPSCRNTLVVCQMSIRANGPDSVGEHHHWWWRHDGDVKIEASNRSKKKKNQTPLSDENNDNRGKRARRARRAALDNELQTTRYCL